MRLSPAPVRSRMRGARTGTGPRPVMIARSGRWPWRTSRWRPSSVCLSAWPLRKAATSASTACANSARAPSRRTSVSGSENSAGWISLTTLSWIMACHSFGGEVEVSNTPTIRCLIPHAVTNFRAYLARERRSHLHHEPDPEPLARTLARLQTDVSTLGRVLIQPLPAAAHQQLAEPWAKVARAAASVLRHTSLALPRRGQPPTLAPVLEALNLYEAAVDELRQLGALRELPNEAVGRVFALGFVLDQFRRNLEDLGQRAAETQSARFGDMDQPSGEKPGEPEPRQGPG